MHLYSVWSSSSPLSSLFSFSSLHYTAINPTSLYPWSIHHHLLLAETFIKCHRQNRPPRPYFLAPSTFCQKITEKPINYSTFSSPFSIQWFSLLWDPFGSFFTFLASVKVVQSSTWRTNCWWSVSLLRREYNVFSPQNATHLQSTSAVLFSMVCCDRHSWHCHLTIVL